jgi:superfamily II DNA or RNA helicase
MQSNIPEMYEHQKKALELSRKLNDIALLWEMGCISGDALIKVNRGKGSRTYTMRDFYQKQNNSFDKSIPSFVRSFKGEHIGLHKVINVLYKGLKEVIRIQLLDGQKLDLTPDHEVMTSKGFIRADKLLDEMVMIDTPNPIKGSGKANIKNFNQGIPHYSKCTRIDYVGVIDVYDIVCNDPYRNFVVNGIIVHNCGKTRGVIEIIRDKFNTNRKIMRTVIFGPVAVIYNWQNEIGKYTKINLSENVFVLSGTNRAEKLKKRLEFNWNGIIILNYESLLSEEVLKSLLKWQPEILVCDESHMLKNYKAKRSKNVLKLAQNATYRILMTGTPILKNSQDIFMQYHILDNGKTFGKSFFVFMGTYFKDKNAAWKGMSHYFPKYEPIPEKEKELTEKIYSKALRVMKHECLDLPPRIEQKVTVELDDKQRVLYNKMKKDFIIFIESMENSAQPIAIVAQLAVTKALRLQQIVCGFVVDDTGKEHDFGVIPRLETCKDLLQQILPNGHKVILWCCFKHDYKILASMFDEMKVKYVFITGEQNAREKQESVDAFQTDGSIQVCIANRRAGGTGINLTAASYSICYSRNFNLADELQSRDRNHRGGSQVHEQIVKIDLIAKDTIDELIDESLNNKEDISNKILTWR